MIRIPLCYISLLAGYRAIGLAAQVTASTTTVSLVRPGYAAARVW